jgi:hypothetical protein
MRGRLATAAYRPIPDRRREWSSRSGCKKGINGRVTASISRKRSPSLPPRDTRTCRRHFGGAVVVGLSIPAIPPPTPLARGRSLRRQRLASMSPMTDGVSAPPPGVTPADERWMSARVTKAVSSMGLRSRSSTLATRSTRQPGYGTARHRVSPSRTRAGSRGVIRRLA